MYVFFFFGGGGGSQMPKNTQITSLSEGGFPSFLELNQEHHIDTGRCLSAFVSKLAEKFPK